MGGGGGFTKKMEKNEFRKDGIISSRKALIDTSKSQIYANTISLGAWRAKLGLQIAQKKVQLSERRCCHLSLTMWSNRQFKHVVILGEMQQPVVEGWPHAYKARI